MSLIGVVGRSGMQRAPMARAKASSLRWMSYQTSDGIHPYSSLSVSISDRAPCAPEPVPRVATVLGVSSSANWSATLFSGIATSKAMGSVLAMFCAWG